MPENSLELSVVLPAYKEKENLAVLIPQIEHEFLGVKFEIIVVDDNSNDGTRELLDELNIKYQNLILVERPGLLGVGSAIRDGYNKAQGKFILSSDADLSFTPLDMRRLYEKIRRGYDLVLGFKVKYQPFSKDDPEGQGLKAARLKFLVSTLGNWTVKFLSGVNLKNFNTNFKILRRDKWLEIKTFENKNFFNFETVLKFSRRDFKISEIPVTFYERKFGSSKLRFFVEAPRYFGKLVWYVFFDKSH